jgi:CRISPR-associated endonuclease/helicase Cas3
MVNQNFVKQISGTWAKTNLRRLAKRMKKKRILLKGLEDWPDGFAFHSLLHHKIDVACCARELLNNPVIAARFKELTGAELTIQIIERVVVIIFLHDLGKVAAGFQDQIFEGASGNSGHVQAWLAALYAWKSPQRQSLFDILDAPEMEKWFCAGSVPGDENSKQNGLYTMLAVSTSHHGGRKKISVIKDYPLSELDRKSMLGIAPLDALTEIVGEMKSLFPRAWENAPPITISGTFIRWFSGLVMASDWMGSDDRQDRFPYWNGDGGAAERMTFATRRAKAMMRDIGMPTAETLGTPHPLSALRDDEGNLLKPRAVQSAILKIPVDQRLVLIEAPTGEGKTEAAVIRYLMLLLTGAVDSMYFAVPTRSAAKELFQRIKSDLAWVMPGIDSGKIIAAVGGDVDGDARAVYGDGNEIPWAAGHPARFMAAPVALGTIDQAYLGIMSVRHADLRHFLLSRSLLVIDEVHAADPFMTELTSALVDRHLKAGGHVLMMSATLGSAARHRISTRRKPSKAPSFDEAHRDFYPQIRYGIYALDKAVVTDEDSRIPTFRSKAVDLRVASFDHAIDQAKKAAAAGARILIIRSTVPDAVETQQALEAAGIKTFSIDGEGTLHHSRFAPTDRKRLDDELLKVIGKKSRVRTSGDGIVCVTTQTGEQSLDLNADLMITDPCPVDVFLQRLGRLHRHEGSRPVGYDKPLCIVLDPGNLDQYIVTEGSQIAAGRPGLGFAFVYKNLLSVKALMAWIYRYGEITVPRDNRMLVEMGTHEGALHETAVGLGDLWETHWNALYAKGAIERHIARRGILDERLSFLTHPESFVSEESLSTRLGEEPVKVPCQSFPGAFGGKVEEVHIPLRKAVEALREEQSLDVLTGIIENISENGTLVRIGKSLYSYSRLGLIEVR